MDYKNVFVITPVLNEVENIPNLLGSWKKMADELTRYNFQFIFVDDGSNDGTAEKAQEISNLLNLDVVLLCHPKNKGPGFSFGTGFDYLSDKLKFDDLVVTIEGDNTSRVDTLKIMMERVLREDIDVALASPLSYGGTVTNTKLHRIFLGHSAAALTKIILGIRGLQTFTSFFRVYQGRVILSLQKRYGTRILEFNGFECMVELLKKITLFNFSITEVPMKLDTSVRKGKSKLKIFKTAISYFRLFLRSRKWH